MDKEDRARRILKAAKKVLARRLATRAIEKAKQSAQSSPLPTKNKPG
jgi:hypothetical protein